MSATEMQSRAIAALGNVLVTAGAGAGKTTTLVERCARLLTDPAGRAGIDQILMVTFTEAAAAEMRARLRKKLEEKRDEAIRQSALPGAPAAAVAAHIEEQLGLLDAANIGTLHSFCFKLVRQNFHALDIDPQVAVLDEAQSAVLRDETLDAVFEQFYGLRQDDAATASAGAKEMGEEVLRLIQTYGDGREQPIRDLVLRIHEYTQTRADPEAWLGGQETLFHDPEPTQWRCWRLAALEDWARRSGLKKAPGRDASTPGKSAGDSEEALLQEYIQVLSGLPPKKSRLSKERLPGELYEEAEFLTSVTARNNGADPLSEDWSWTRTHMVALLHLVRSFSAAYSEAKKEQAALDFHDLEQFSLRLLWDHATGKPTTIAIRMRQQFRFVFVDETQDINGSQDAILRAVSDDASPNRFLVGDVKQSIYRFRLADPHIFQEYERAWRGSSAGAQVLSLRENFRSREALLDFFNAVFRDLMREEVGRVGFDEEAKLLFGAPAERHLLGREASPGPRVHVHLRITSKDPDGNGSEEIAELTAAEQEARIVANALVELQRSGHKVWDRDHERPVEWRDMAVLLRSPAGKAEIYAREFGRQEIPIAVAQESFFAALEVADILNVLKVLDNPLQDVPLIAVLHSPIGGFTPDELVEVRLAARRERFWTALKRFCEIGRGSPVWPKADRFLRRFQRWRRMGRDTSLSARIETILTETSYVDWLAARTANAERSGQCARNMRRLLSVAEEFDPLQRQGLTRFLRFVEAQQQAREREPVANAGNAVQLLSIHRSKGLEYPVVVISNLGKRFNLGDLHGNVLLDGRLGLCPRVKPPGSGRRYPSLAHWLAAKNERAELLGEEMRLLYVAMTRARDTLLLVGTASESAAEKWAEADESAENLLKSTSMIAWLGPWLARHAEQPGWLDAPGTTPLFSWTIEGNEAPPPIHQPGPDHQLPPVELPADFEQSCEQLARVYPFAAAAREAAKASVSSLRRTMQDEEARPWRRPRLDPVDRDGLSAAQIGVAHHTFLEFATLEQIATPGNVLAEAARLVKAGSLSAEEAAHLDVEALAAFWAGDIGRQIFSAPDVRRELAFTARFEMAELAALGLAGTSSRAAEFVIVQGIIDVAVLFPNEIWLLDFKTDHVDAAALPGKVQEYRTQLGAYAAAMERIYGRPVKKKWLHFLAARQTVEL